MRSCTKWNSDLLASQFGCGRLVDFQTGRHNAVVVFSVRNRNVDDLNVLASGCSNHERWNTL